jgi:hypothetical protein
MYRASVRSHSAVTRVGCGAALAVVSTILGVWALLMIVQTCAMPVLRRVKTEESAMKKRPVIGRRVRSLYKARWTGIIEDYTLHPTAGCIAHVRITHDRRGNPVRKQKLYSYNWCLFEYVG